MQPSLAKDCAFAHTLDRLDPESLVCALFADSEASLLRAGLLARADLEALLALLGQPTPCPGLMEPDEGLLALLHEAAELASGRGRPTAAGRVWSASAIWLAPLP